MKTKVKKNKKVRVMMKKRMKRKKMRRIGTEMINEISIISFNRGFSLRFY